MTTWQRIHAGRYISPDGRAAVIRLGAWGLTPITDIPEHDPTFPTLSAAQAYYAQHPYPADGTDPTIGSGADAAGSSKASATLSIKETP